jgi:hypothetical protein
MNSVDIAARREWPPASLQERRADIDGDESI